MLKAYWRFIFSTLQPKILKLFNFCKPTERITVKLSLCTPWSHMGDWGFSCTGS